MPQPIILKYYDAGGKVAIDVRCERENVRWVKKHGG